MARPSEYKEEYADRLIAHMAQGFSFESFGSDCDVSAMTLYNWVDRYDDFAKAKAIAEVKCLNFWENLCVHGALGTTSVKDKHGNVQKIKVSAPILIYNLRCRFKKYGWNQSADEEPEKGKPDVKEQARLLLEKLTEAVRDQACLPKTYSENSSESQSQSGLLTACSKPESTT